MSDCGLDEECSDADDLPSTHLDDDDYAAFVAAEFDGEGRPRSDTAQRVTWIIGFLIVLVVVLAFAVFL